MWSHFCRSNAISFGQKSVSNSLSTNQILFFVPKANLLLYEQKKNTKRFVLFVNFFANRAQNQTKNLI